MPEKRSATTDLSDGISPKVAKKSEENIDPANGSLSPEEKVTTTNASLSPNEKSEVAGGSLSPEQRKSIESNRLEAVEKLNKKMLSNIDMNESWKNALKSEFEKSYFKRLTEFLAKERQTKTIYPPEKDVFRWTKFHDIEDTKVVIIGQDPYHGPKQAHGLCFSVQIGIPPPPSLKNIYKELEKDIPNFVIPKHGHLIGWSSQGVLLINTCLTVVANQANSHKGQGWEKFTDATIKWINRNTEGVVFILWGNDAQKKGQFLNKSRHLVLAGKHPSPLSAHRGYFGCKHFSKTNTYLKEKGKKEIDWNYLPESI